MSRPSQSDVTIADKATVTLHRKIEKKGVEAHLRLDWKKQRCGDESVPRYRGNRAVDAFSQLHVFFLCKKNCFSVENYLAFGFLSYERKFSRSRCVPKSQQWRRDVPKTIFSAFLLCYDVTIQLQCRFLMLSDN